MLRLIISLLLLSAFSIQAGTEEKMELIIPQFKCEDKTVKQVLTAIKKLSKSLDPEKKGINIIFKGSDRKVLSRKITLDLSHISLNDAIKYTCLPVDLYYKVSKNAVEISNNISQTLNTSFFAVSTSFASTVRNKKTKLITRKALLKFFTDSGFNFPPGASVAYIKNASRVSMTNTATNIQRTKKLLLALNWLR
ncbi:MAG: hypothetical protein HRT88_13615 [Lentisphaeraceae bacterium]|nr:hypothetical protein [Lentisphaeraceae bacterium]